MTEKTAVATYLEKNREDAEEMIAVLERVPEERKREVLGIVKGYALCAENDERAAG